MRTIADLVEDTKRRRADGAKRYGEHDEDLCMLCEAYGADKRSLFVSCFYDVNEVVPEALDIGDVPNERGFYLRICKSCRGRFLGHLREWRVECVALRGTPKDHDGHPEEQDPDRNIPIRVDGTTVLLTREEWDARHPVRVPMEIQR